MEADAESDGSLVWRALADPTRRQILDLLRQRPRITGDIASRFVVSRIAVMRHLEVLAEAGLVTSRKRGRERWHYLNAVPLQRIHERWVDLHAGAWASSLLQLRRRAGKMTIDKPIIDMALDVSIEASQGQVFAALTEDPGAWWGLPYLNARTTSLTLEPRLGGLLLEHWDGGGGLLATVTSWSADRHLELSGPFHLGLALGIASFELIGSKSSTTVQFSFRAFGPIAPDMAEAFAKGWRELVTQRLKTYVETGTRLGIAPDPPNRR